MTAKEIFESKQWDMINGIRYLDEAECISLIEELTNDRTAIELIKDLKDWDIEQSLKHMQQKGTTKFTLPHELRKRMEAILDRADL